MKTFRGENWAGRVFGRLTAISFDGKTASGPMWKCQCACGVIKRVSASNLRSGSISSCGCLRREKICIHGLTIKRNRHPVYVSWSNMVERCTNSKIDQWKDYGG